MGNQDEVSYKRSGADTVQAWFAYHLHLQIYPYRKGNVVDFVAGYNAALHDIAIKITTKAPTVPLPVSTCVHCNLPINYNGVFWIHTDSRMYPHLPSPKEKEDGQAANSNAKSGN